MKEQSIIRRAGRILSLLLTAVMLLIIVFNLYTIAAKKLFHEPLPMLAGYASAVVLSGSMEGEREDSLSVNDMIIIHRQEDYEVGDVVTYSVGLRTPTTHRITEKDGETFVTQGDANNAADPPIDKSDIRGKVILILPGIGTLIQKLQTPLGLFMLLLVGVVLLEGQTILSWISGKKRQEP